MWVSPSMIDKGNISLQPYYPHVGQYNHSMMESTKENNTLIQKWKSVENVRDKSHLKASVFIPREKKYKVSFKIIGTMKCNHFDWYCSYIELYYNIRKLSTEHKKIHQTCIINLPGKITTRVASINFRTYFITHTKYVFKRYNFYKDIARDSIFYTLIKPQYSVITGSLTFVS